ncbi:hypothetical protein HY214_00715 [Candidatus Roizmanbacteria bacterium]|nr:hypothetical protein [Candidatus Roizmanbacteria bacterium]
MLRYTALNFSDPNSFAGAKFDSVGKIVNLLLPLAMTGFSLVFLAMLLWGAFMWLTASGNPENVKKAQKNITFAVFGLIVIISAYLIVKLLALVLNISNLPL